MATAPAQEKPKAAAAQEAAAPAVPPIQMKLTPAVTHATFHGTDIDFTKDEVVVHTNEKVRLVPADEDATATKGTFDIRRAEDFNFVATRGTKVSRDEKTGKLTVSFDPDIEVSVQAVPAAPAL